MMDRHQFIRTLGITGIAMFLPVSESAGRDSPQELRFKDDGKIPNSRLPLILYRNVFEKRGTAGAAWLESRFRSNNWTNSWRNGIYSFHHYHSTTHEVLGIYSGTARVHLGGEQGEKVEIHAGDVIIIPAGVGHKNLGSSDLGVVGAYPDGRSWDLMRGHPGERPSADNNIAAVPMPATDPLYGPDEGLPQLWAT